MKSVLIFSNPFGYGPSGKAASIAKCLSERTVDTKIIICSSEHLLDIIGRKFTTREVNDRDEDSIVEMLSSISGDKYIVSSQNRFAIRAAKKSGLPSAFLDGLSWFWREIPGEHFLADIIFWINYPSIKDKIPENHKDKITIVGGITEELVKPVSGIRSGIEFYLGGCENPLAPISQSYLDLTANLLSHESVGAFIIAISTDPKSQEYLNKYPKLAEKIIISDHAGFMKRIARCRLLLTNGGQTAAIEAANLATPNHFFLPMNLSQMSFINKIVLEDKNYPYLNWGKYVKLPPGLPSYSEKQALEYFNIASKTVLADKKKMSLLQTDFLQILLRHRNARPPKILMGLGSTGSEDIICVLKEKWGLI